MNFEYLTRILENYGFVITGDEEAKAMGFPKGTGTFSELFEIMMNEVHRNPRAESDYGVSMKMTSDEKMISFMNRYFIFRKERNVDTDAIFKVIRQTRNNKSALESTEPSSQERLISTPIKITVKRRKLKVPNIVITESKSEEDNSEWKVINPPKRYPGYE